MNVADVPVDLIDLDSENPNRMSDAKYQALVAAIRLVGWNQNTVLEGPFPNGRYLMRDGNHRLRAARELGHATVPAVIAPVGSKLGMAAGLIFNNIRGAIDETAAATVLDNLVDAGWSMEDLQVTGFSDQEVADLVAALRSDSPDEMLGPSGGGAAEELDDLVNAPSSRERPFRLEVDFADRKLFVAVKRALRRAAGKGRPLSEGLAKVLGLDAQDGERAS